MMKLRVDKKLVEETCDSEKAKDTDSWFEAKTIRQYFASREWYPFLGADKEGYILVADDDGYIHSLSTSFMRFVYDD